LNSTDKQVDYCTW